MFREKNAQKDWVPQRPTGIQDFISSSFKMADCFDGCSDGMDVRVVQQGRGWGVKTGFGFAILAGFFAALASVFAKISFSNVIIGSIVCGQHTSLNGPNLTSTSTGKELFHPHSVIKCEIVRISLGIKY